MATTTPTLRVRRLDANHDMTFGAGRRNFAERAEAAAQGVGCDVRVIRGEWFLNTEDGVPWWSNDPTVKAILGNGRDLDYTAAVLKQVILARSGIDSINTFDISVNAARKVSMTCNLNTVDGDVADIVQAPVGF